MLALRFAWLAGGVFAQLPPGSCLSLAPSEGNHLRVEHYPEPQAGGQDGAEVLADVVVVVPRRHRGRRVNDRRSHLVQAGTAGQVNPVGEGGPIYRE
jgi:hypothetical protein